MKNNKIIYSITIEDIQTVVEENFDRRPSKEEIQFVEERIGERIGWFDIIENILSEYNNEESQKKR